MPFAPFSTLDAALPVRLLASALPVPLIAADPVSVRFSTKDRPVFVARLNVIELLILSVPPAFVVPLVVVVS